METGKKVCFCDTGRQRAVSEEHDFFVFCTQSERCRGKSIGEI
jgi:hypothetical protein